MTVNSPIESWVLDSGASFHSTSYREIMENYVSSDFGKAYLADDELLKIVKKEIFGSNYRTGLYEYCRMLDTFLA